MSDEEIAIATEAICQNYDDTPTSVNVFNQIMDQQSAGETPVPGITGWTEDSANAIGVLYGVGIPAYCPEHQDRVTLDFARIDEDATPPASR